MKPKRRVIAAVGSAAVIAGGSWTGVSVAAPSHRAAAGATTERIALTATAQNVTHVLLRGPLTAAGTDKALSAHKDRLLFGDGTLTIVHRGPEHRRFFKATCTVIYTQKGHYTIGHGTGSYRGWEGSGSFVARFAGRGPRDSSGNCVKTSHPKGFVGLVLGHGPISHT